MANTRIRRKSLSNKKRRSNKKKSVRRQKKVGGKVVADNAAAGMALLNKNQYDCVQYQKKDTGEEVVIPARTILDKNTTERTNLLASINWNEGLSVTEGCSPNPSGKCVKSNCDPSKKDCGCIETKEEKKREPKIAYVRNDMGDIVTDRKYIY